ncbi:PREDICTED: cysteine-rich secretory protein 3-like [Miniopterus natalensis]|uniref:cysteine-rich secretory protein 3-like n=1 Tax=Miniopterus natalensis TaxID=291302 RepID=UPI0007A6DBC0|nr:PREDICTED: cysteine-rich secretory protein 3-like [Miniopterus natalensis]
MALLPVLLFLVPVLLPFFPADGKNPGFGDLSTTLTEAQREIVNKHNDLRRTVTPPAKNMLKMKWDNKTAENAQKWADKCLQEHSTLEDRVISMNCGENLYMSSDPTSWSHAIQTWFDEIKDFDYGIGPKYKDAVVGHYTQVVWYSSYTVGCGVAYCPEQPSLKYYYVCQYCPAGNVQSKTHIPYLKGIPCASCPDHCDNGLCTNTCDYEDAYSNCKDLKNQLGCENPLVKNSCKASCNCEKKIY